MQHAIENPSPKICFIGGGNMTNAIVTGLVKTDYQTQSITVIDHHPEKCDFFKQILKINAYSEISDVSAQLNHMDIIVLAIKPQGFATLLPTLKPFLNKQLIISIAAGIEIKTLEALLTQLPIIRAMPNTPSAVNLGATGLFANHLCRSIHKTWADKILKSCGICCWLEDESLISAIVALSGSGPAYFLYLMESMEKAAIELGLSATLARQFVLQTALGTSSLAHQVQDETSPQALRAKVTSAKGTTEQAILSFQTNQFEAIISQGMNACYHRDKSLSTELTAQILKHKL